MAGVTGIEPVAAVSKTAVLTFRLSFTPIVWQPRLDLNQRLLSQSQASWANWTTGLLVVAENFEISTPGM